MEDCFENEPIRIDYSYIYEIINKITGKGYGGQTIYLEKRMNEHKRSNDSCRYLNRSIKKHGWENFTVNIVDQGWFTREERDQKEIALIARKGYFWGDGGGYNLTKGGGGMVGFKHREDSKAKMSAAHMGEKNHMYGKKPSAEKNAAQSKRMKGRKLSAKTIAKMSAASKGKKKSAEHRANISAANQRRCRGKRKGDDKWVEFDSIMAATSHFKCSRGTVCKIINGKCGSRYYEFERL